MKMNSLIAILVFLVIDASASNCAQTSVGFVPLIDMTPSDQYLGEDGMLYPGSNTPPPNHMTDVMAAANSIVPLDLAGNPSSGGEIVWFSCGMSNTNGKSNELLPLTEADPLKAPEVKFVNGANGGIPVEDMVSPAADYWVNIVPSKLSARGVTADQVQVVWLLQTHRGPSGPFGTWYLNLRDDLGHVCRNLYANFPNLKIIYVSPRSYAGYADGTLNPEPYAYQSGFSYKKLIDDQLSGDSTLAYSGASQQTAIIYWSEYLYIWADGETPNGMGLSYVCGDYNSEGTHPSTQGYQKIASYMLNFYQTDPTCVWYRGTGGGGTTDPPPPPPTSGGGGENCYDPNHPCFAKPNKAACEGDCECARCYGGGATDPIKGCVPACRQSECGGSWDPFNSPCAGGPPTSDPPPPPTSDPPPPPPPTSDPPPPPTSDPPPPTTAPPPTFDCSVFNGNPSGCMGDCRCGYCSNIADGCGCLTGDASGPDPSHGCTCSGTWQFFGPC